MPPTVEICYQGQWTDYRLYDAESMTFGALTAYLLERYQVGLNEFDGLVFNGHFLGERVGEFSYDMKTGRLITTQQPATIHLLRRRAQPTREQLLQYPHLRITNAYPNRSLFSYHFEEWLREQLVHAVDLPIDQLQRYVTLICQTQTRPNHPLYPITSPYRAEAVVAADEHLQALVANHFATNASLIQDLESVRITLAPALLGRLPLCTFAAYRSDHAMSATQSSCVICCEDFQEAEEIRVLTCQHAFHRCCIDAWLTVQSVRCPLCRVDLRESFLDAAEKND